MKKYFFAVVCCLLFGMASNAVAQVETERYYQFLQELQRDKNAKLYPFYVNELEQFLRVYPFSLEAPDVMYMLGQSHEKRKKNELALTAYLKIAYLYPASGRQGEAIDRARRILLKDKDFASGRKRILPLLENIEVAETNAERTFNFFRILRHIADYGVSDLNAPAIQEGFAYLHKFPDEARNDQAMMWLGDLYNFDKDYVAAAAAYQKVGFLYPESIFLSESRFKRARVMAFELKKAREAVPALNAILADDPNNPVANDAQILIARIQEEKLKDRNAAINAYREVVNNALSDSVATFALFKMAGLFTKQKGGGYQSALATYQEVIDNYPNRLKSAEALEKMGDIYLKIDGKDYARAAEHYAQISEIAPEYKNAPKLLLKGAELYDSKLKDYERAIEMYDKVIATFPDHKVARNAAKKQRKAQDRLASTN